MHLFLGAAVSPPFFRSLQSLHKINTASRKTCTKVVFVNANTGCYAKIFRNHPDVTSPVSSDPACLGPAFCSLVLTLTLPLFEDLCFLYVKTESDGIKYDVFLDEKSSYGINHA